MSERCARCGITGDDRRTLKMACFYDMGELPIPFDTMLILIPPKDAEFTVVKPPAIIDALGVSPFVLVAPEVTCSSTLTPEELYTLRVCKRCRGEWLRAIRDWFRATPRGNDYDADEPAPSETGSGIFIRRNGAIEEVTEESEADDV